MRLEDLPWFEHGGESYLLGSAGSLILTCPKCGEESFIARKKKQIKILKAQLQQAELALAEKDPTAKPKREVLFGS